ncbi:MAG TPA: hypothetical protein IGS17_19320 [Oscillatoriales cyanobacterium M59_W2019_021]|nr:hypothetical protein [Oscillatoriales cyanobacterium M4454_W2019_049]HIK53049.1 hypothetical protein [Oscillatoriales cyanobacterium M59_W2019_021]
MSEKTTTQSVVTQLPDSATHSSCRSIDTDVDRLIEDVFADVDRALERNTGLPSEPALPKTVSLNPLQIPPIVMRPLVMPHQQAAEFKDEDEDKDTVTVKATPSDDDEDKLGQLFDRFLVGTAIASLALISGLWLWSRPDVRKFVTTAISGEKVEPESPVAVTNAPTEEDKAFIEYVNRSLDRINPTLTDRGITPLPQNPNTAQNPANPPLPILSIPFNPAAPDAMAQSLSRIATALEKFSVTALRPPQPANANNPIRPTTPTSPRPAGATPSPSPSPTAASPSPSPTAASPSPSPTAAATPSPTPSPQAQAVAPAAPSDPEVATAPEPEVPDSMLIDPDVPSKPSLAPVQPVPEAESTPTDIYALLGILQFGDRSAALFEVNGVPSRVNVGESIGSSGWTLVEVTDQQARIRRNGEVRDIFVGQQF